MSPAVLVLFVVVSSVCACVVSAPVDPTIVCAMRSLALEYAQYLQPPTVNAKWSALVYDGLQLRYCNQTETSKLKRSRLSADYELIDPPSPAPCAVEVFVDGTNGADTNNGTFSAPLQSLSRALRLIRVIRGMRAVSACLTLRSGTYEFAASVNSAVGGVSLTAADSALTIQAYENEDVTLSGGRRFTPQWRAYAKTPAGTIYSTILPDDIDVRWDAFNELYVDKRRVPRARWPNADPSTQGLHTPPSTGWIPSASNWSSPSALLGSNVQIVAATPNRNGTAFPNYHVHVGGGADSLYSPPRSFWAGGTKGIYPGGLKYHSADLPNVNKWNDPTDGPAFVHAYHSGHWGQWVFSVDSVEVESNQINFGGGGWQEGRGSSSGAEWYVDNIFEELDAPNEWFLDRINRTLYFMPNISSPPPTLFIASQRPCLISLHGSAALPVENIAIAGVTLAFTSNTFFKPYDVPSGGDWSVHRGGAVFATGSSGLILHHSLLTELGGNGVVLSDWNLNATITHNQCVWVGDSCVIAVGSAAGVDGVSRTTQPTNTVVTSNIMSEMGIYTKQSSAVMTAVSRSTTIQGNVLFNCPRALININDGFHGDLDIHHNLLFGAIRETSDHGPFNSWDRQVYLTQQTSSVGDPTSPTTTPAPNYLHHNFVINSYNSVWVMQRTCHSPQHTSLIVRLTVDMFVNRVLTTTTAVRTITIITTCFSTRDQRIISATQSTPLLTSLLMSILTLIRPNPEVLGAAAPPAAIHTESVKASAVGASRGATTRALSRPTLIRSILIRARSLIKTCSRSLLITPIIPITHSNQFVVEFPLLLLNGKEMERTPAAKLFRFRRSRQSYKWQKVFSNGNQHDLYFNTN